MAAPHRSLRDVFDRPGFAWAARPGHVQARVELLRAALGPSSGPLDLLDLGCGSGENTRGVAEGVGAARAVGLDWSAAALTRARAGSLVVVRAAVDGAVLPFSDATFDVVVLSEVIEHLVDTDRAVEEARRVLRPGGVLLVTTPNLASWFNRILLAIGFQPAFSEVSARKVFGRPGTDVVGHLRLFTRRALVAFLQDFGFVDLRLAGHPFHGVPRPLRPLDRLLARWPDVAAALLAVARKPGPSAP